MPQKIVLITGPARSGKSEWAEQLAQQSTKPIIYIATAQRFDDDPEWQQRLRQHQTRRPPHWQLQEVPLALPTAIQQARADDCLLIDSLGTWLANLIDLDATAWAQQQADLLASIAATPCDLILVAEETGWGVVPAYPSGRIFRDRLGSLVRQVGAIATQVYLVTGGYALDLKHLGTPIGPSLPTIQP